MTDSSAVCSGGLVPDTDGRRPESESAVDGLRAFDLRLVGLQDLENDPLLLLVVLRLCLGSIAFPRYLSASSPADTNPVG